MNASVSGIHDILTFGTLAEEVLPRVSLLFERAAHSTVEAAAVGPGGFAGVVRRRAGFAHEPRRAGALKAVDQIGAGAAVQAGGGRALVDVDLTKSPYIFS